MVPNGPSTSLPIVFRGRHISIMPTDLPDLLDQGGPAAAGLTAAGWLWRSGPGSAGVLAREALARRPRVLLA